MSTKSVILAQLQYGPQTSYALGVATDKPQASIRRTIGALRADGYDIITRGTGLNAEYVLALYGKDAIAVAQADGDHGDAFDTNIEGDAYRGPNGDEGEWGDF